MNITLYHGSECVVRKPSLRQGKLANDYGRGFYCTRDKSAAGEWACKNGRDGYVNEFILNDADLRTLNFLDGNWTILNWIAILLKYRTFDARTEVAHEAREYMIRNFAPEHGAFDVVVGYRANDSYFAFAQGFISNSISLRSLNRAMRLGGLGMQTALVSEKAFSHLSFIAATPASSAVYAPLFNERDSSARKAYRDEVRTAANFKDDIFALT